MDEWKDITALQPWALGADQPEAALTRLQGFSAPAETQMLFPRFTRLLTQARRSLVALKEGDHHLLVWGTAESGLRAWLEPAPRDDPSVNLWTEHHALLLSFGGICERFNEPEPNMLMNHNDALTPGIAAGGAGFLDDYAWKFEDVGGIPIDVAEFYPIAWEANGNCVLCSRESGRLVFFAPDHADPHLRTLPGCPEYSLHSHSLAPDFRSWVERIALEWSASDG